MRNALPNPAWLAAAMFVLLTASPLAFGETDAAYTAIWDEIWANEQAIYKPPGNGDLSDYVADASANDRGWLPSSDAPRDR